MIEKFSKVQLKDVEKLTHPDLYFLEKISDPINNFLDNVTVNTENIKLQNNRQSLLYKCMKILNSFFNFSS